MKQADLVILDEVLNNWQTIYFNHCETAIQMIEMNNLSLIDVYSSSKLKLLKHEINNYSNISSDCIKIYNNSNEKNKQYSCNFNVFHFFNITEPKHSFLLSQLLNPNASHGQGNLFLKYFLSMLEIEQPDKGRWFVTAEIGNIDILLKRSEPHSIIIIENKSNYAKDQENQLYRYWYQEIYYPNRHLGFDYSNQHPEKYKVVYLTPDSGKLPTDNTLSKPNDWSSELPDSILIPTIIEFSSHIVDWLKKCLEEIPETNNRLKEYIKQYIELWN